jgi:peptidoglycan/LPS O-acetylase OafA/YrhL
MPTDLSIAVAPIEASRSSIAAPASKPSVAPYWPQLDGLRSLAFLLVFLHHLGRVADVERAALGSAIAPALPALDAICAWGWVGVDVFFSLSGFLITHLLLAEKGRFNSISFKQFFARRALRIWPVYYLVLLFACVVVPLMQWQSLNWPLYYEFLAKQGVPLTFFAGNYSLTFATNILLKFTSAMAWPVVFLFLPLWSLAVEEQFYLTWPFLLKVLPTAKALYRTIAALAVFSVAARAILWYVSRYQYHIAFPVNLYYQTTFSHLEPLMAGAACAVTVYYFPDLLTRLKRFAPLLISALVAVVVPGAIFLPDIVYNSYYNIATFSIVALSCLLLLTTTLVSPGFAKFFSNKALSAFGRLTYAMYLVHYFAIAMAEKIWQGNSAVASSWQLQHWPTKLVLALGMTYLFAFVSWHLLERHFLKMRKHFSR